MHEFITNHYQLQTYEIFIQNSQGPLMMSKHRYFVNKFGHPKMIPEISNYINGIPDIQKYGISQNPYIVEFLVMFINRYLDVGNYFWISPSSDFHYPKFPLFSDVHNRNKFLDVHNSVLMIKFAPRLIDTEALKGHCEVWKFEIYLLYLKEYAIRMIY